MGILLLESFVCPFPVIVPDEKYKYDEDHETSSESESESTTSQQASPSTKYEQPPRRPETPLSIADHGTAGYDTPPSTSDSSHYTWMEVGKYIMEDVHKIQEIRYSAFLILILDLRVQDNDQLKEIGTWIKDIMDDQERAKYLSDYTDAWKKGELYVYEPLGKLINWVVGKIRNRHCKDDSCFPGIQKCLTVEGRNGQDGKHNVDDRETDNNSEVPFQEVLNDDSDDSEDEHDDSLPVYRHDDAEEEVVFSGDDEADEIETSSDYDGPLPTLPKIEGKPMPATIRHSDIQAMSYMSKLFDGLEMRTHVISVVATKNGFEFFYCDGSAALRTEVKLEDFEVFITFIYGLLRLDKRGWGYMSFSQFELIG